MIYMESKWYVWNLAWLILTLKQLNHGADNYCSCGEIHESRGFLAAFVVSGIKTMWICVLEARKRNKNSWQIGYNLIFIVFPAICPAPPTRQHILLNQRTVRPAAWSLHWHLVVERRNKRTARRMNIKKINGWISERLTYDGVKTQDIYNHDSWCSGGIL